MPFFETATGKKRKIYYELYNPQGKRTPVLLCHCWTGNLDFYNALIPLLPKDRPYVLVDLPGHGRSDPIPPFSPEAFAGHLRSLLIALGFHQVVMGGHSLGGMTAIAYAASSSDSLKGLMLLHTTASLKAFAGQREFGQLTYLLMHVIPKPLWGVGIALSAFHPLSSIGLRLKTALACLNTPSSITRKTLREILSFDQRDALKSIKVPVLIVAGASDFYTDLRHALFLKKKLPQAKLHVLPLAGHMGILEQPFALAEAVSLFLQECA